MTDLPRPPIEPLDPRPGSFDAVVARARSRRHRHLQAALSVAAVFFVGLAGGASLDGGVSGVGQSIVRLAAAPGEGAATSAASQNTSAAVTPDVDGTSGPSSPERPGTGATPGPSLAAAAPAPPLPAVRTLRGVALDTAGAPIAGLYVYPGQPGPRGYLATARPATRTDTNGRFRVPCTSTPILLSPHLVNEPVGATAEQAVWAATFVGGGTEAASAAAAPCPPDGGVVRTTVLPGSGVAGTVTVPDECGSSPLPLWVWLHNDRTLTIRLEGLASGDSFTVRGLPPGQHTLGANGNRTTVTVGGGAVTTQDVTFACVPGAPTPEPSATDVPMPTPSETATAPAPTPSSDPYPSPVMTPTPTGTTGP